jgi:hypothetical protein
MLQKGGLIMEHHKEENAPVILDFNGDIAEAVNKLASILYTSGWNKYLMIEPDVPSEDKLLFSLICEGAIYVGEVYYTFTNDFTGELESRAKGYSHRLRKKNMDIIYLNAVNHFSKYEPDIEQTENGALFYPDINAYVRCGDLSPGKLFELMRKDGCERIIIFGSGVRQGKEQSWEAFHSFEMRAPKEYIAKMLENLQDERIQSYHRAMEKLKINDVIPDVPFLTDEDEPK